MLVRDLPSAESLCFILEQDTVSCLVLVQPRKIRPDMTDFVDWDIKHQNKHTVKTLYTDTLYNSKILYKVNICTNVPALELELITTEIQFNIKLFGDKLCHCQEG